jgi:poly-gamma-glutamate capsule biosynthesis protein CapA/YwtB (metallophosphatase superfamily)
MQHLGRLGRGAWGFAVAALILPCGEVAAQQPQPYRDALGNMTFALGGDAIITRKLSVYSEPEFLEIRDLMRSATAAFVNAEMLFLNYDEPGVIPASQSGGTYMRAQPELADELVWMGVDLVSTANNHSLDYSFGGLQANTRWLAKAGLVAAGTGENLAEARAPHYLETAGGRVALIAVSSTFADFNPASPQRQDMRGRPGLNPLRVQTTYIVPADRFEQLLQMRSGLGQRTRSGAEEIRLGGATFRKGDAYKVTNVIDTMDLNEITAEVRDAKRQADWVIVSSHTHQGGATTEDFLIQFAHAAIDAGADIFVAHGPHVLRGIEIYKGKPIFYSLANFIMENETIELQPWENYASVGLGNEALPGEFYDARNKQSPTGGFPAGEAFWESVVAVPQFQGGRLSRIDLHPITLGFGLDRAVRGRPMAAKGELARKIITRLQELSKPFGTTITFENGLGLIRVGAGG